MDATIHSNLRAVLCVVKSLNGVFATFAKFKTPVRDIEKGMHGNGVLCSQKVLYSLAFLGMVDRGFLKYCLPGSKLHFKRLQAAQFSFDTICQVQQLVDAISSIGDENGKIPAPKAEEIVCKLLKPNVTFYFDCVIRGVDLFWSVIDSSGNASVFRRRYSDCRSYPLLPVNFISNAHSYYYPIWAQLDKPLNRSGLGVRFGTEKNRKFSVCEKSGPAARTRLNGENILALEEDFLFGNVQTLLNKNRSVFIADPVGLIVKSFGINRHCFSDSIRTRRSVDGNGWLSSLNPAVFHGIPLMHTFRQPHQVDASRRSCFDLAKAGTGSISYKSRDGSVMALLLHLLTNVRVSHKNHWTKDFLNDTKEFVLLIPGNTEHTCAVAVGVIMRLDEKIVMRQFRECSLVVERAIRIAHCIESN